MRTTRQPAIDTVYIWQQKFSDKKLNVKQYKNYSYLKSGIVLNSEDETVYRYVKDYGEFCLLMVSFEKRKTYIEKFLDDIAKKVKPQTQELTKTGIIYE